MASTGDRAYLAQVKPYGDKGEGWQWLELHPNGGASERRTDPQGEGLWTRGADGWTQGRGHMQFHLPSDRGQAISKLLKLMRDRYYFDRGDQVEVIHDDALRAYTVAVQARDGRDWYTVDGGTVTGYNEEEALAKATAADGPAKGPRRIRVWEGILISTGSEPAAELVEEG